MLWPGREEFSKFKLIPPILAIDTSGLRRMLGRLRESHRARNTTWHPVFSSTLLHSVLADSSLKSLIDGVSFGGVLSLAAPASGMIPSATLLCPPVVGHGPHLVAELAREIPIAVACDHFAQAERLNAACREVGSQLQIGLRIDVGLGRVGVRPGPDLDELIRGVLKLKSLQLNSLIFPAAEGSPNRGASLQPSALQSVVERGCAIMLRYELPERSISFGDFIDLPKANDPGFSLAARTPLDLTDADSIAILTGVVGRPTRDQVVIDAGRRILGESVFVADDRRHDLSLRWLGDDFAVLQLENERHDIAIGDILPLVPRDLAQVPDLPRLCRTGENWFRPW